MSVLCTGTTTGRIFSNGSGVASPTGAWQIGLWLKANGYGTTQFKQAWSWPGLGDFIGMDTGETDTSSPYDSFDGYAGSGSPQAVLSAADTAWIFVGVDHAASSANYRWRFRKEGVGTFTTFTINAGAQLGNSNTFSLFGSEFGDPVDCYLRSFFMQGAQLTDADLLTVSQSLGAPSIGTNLTVLALNDATSGTTLGDNLTANADWSVTVSGFSTQAGVEPNPALAMAYIPQRIDDLPPAIARGRSFVAMRGSMPGTQGQVLVPMSTAVVVVPQEPSVPLVRRVVSRELQSGAPLNVLAAPTPGVQFYGDAAQLAIRGLRLDRDAGNGIAPPAIGTLGVGTSWYTQEQRPAPRARVTPEPAQVPIVPSVSAATLTWFAHSPTLIRKSAGTDAGADAISPLNPPHGSWFPDAPDRAVFRRWLRDEPGSGLVRPLTTNAVVFVAPDAAWTPRRRYPVQEDGADLGDRPLYLANLSWLSPDASVPRARRAPVADGAASPLADVAGGDDLSWAATQADPIRFPRRILGEVTLALGGLTGAYDVSWMAVTPDRTAARRLPQPEPVPMVLVAMSQATDLSWGNDPGHRPATSRKPLDAGQPPPVGTTVTLSAWGWIPEAHPARKGLKVVDATPVSALVPPAIVTTLAQGWYPWMPDRPGPKRTNTDPATVLVQPLTVMAVTSWFPEDSAGVSRRRPVAQQDAVPPSRPLAGSEIGWLPEWSHPRPARPSFRTADMDIHPVRVVSADATQGQDGWVVRRRPARGDHATIPNPAPSGSVAFWEPVSPAVVARARIDRTDQQGPVRPLVATVLPPMPTQDDANVVFVKTAAALRVALLSESTFILVGGGITATELRAILTELGDLRAILRS